MQKQKYGYGCGLYAVANAFDLESFVTEERLELSKKGVHNGELSKYMQEDGHNIFIEVLYCNTFESKLPEEWVLLHVSGDINYFPFLIQCMINEKYHLMGAKLYKDDTIELFDSLKTEPLKCTLKEVNLMYEKVVALYGFNHFETNEYVFF